MNDWLLLALGIACAGAGGEFFVRGAVGLARWARIAPGIIGATVAAFATSSPELAVAVSAALAGDPKIALGNALGANVVNVALILALVIAFTGLRVHRDALRRDFPVALAVPVATAVLLADGELSRPDGVLMLALFAAWLAVTAVEARRQRSAAQAVLGEARHGMALLSGAGGLALLAAAGALIVAGARGIATELGLDEFVIGATIVALGTTVPELATALVSRLRGHDEVGLGTILGSNIFNGLFIVAVAAVVRPIAADPGEVAVALGFGLVALACTWPGRSGHIGRGRGALLLGLYAAYVGTIIGLGAA